MKVQPKKTAVRKKQDKMAEDARKAAIKAQQDFKMPKEVVDAINNMGKPKKKRCFWPWNHNWSNWRTIETGRIQRVRAYYFSQDCRTIDKGNYKVQERNCLNCNKTEMYTLTTTIDD